MLCPPDTLCFLQTVIAERTLSSTVDGSALPDGKARKVSSTSTWRKLMMSNEYVNPCVYSKYQVLFAIISFHQTSHPRIRGRTEHAFHPTEPYLPKGSRARLVRSPCRTFVGSSSWVERAIDMPYSLGRELLGGQSPSLKHGRFSSAASFSFCD